MLYENMNMLQKLTHKSILITSMLWFFIFGPIIGLIIGYKISPGSNMFIIGIIIWIIGIGIICVVYPATCPEDR